MKVSILTPSLRKDRWPAVIENIAETCDAIPVLLGEEFPLYATAVNTAYGYDTASFAPSDYYFTGSDDITFMPGWLDEALKVMAEDGIEVVGTNDLMNDWVMAGEHATHYLVSRRYLDEVGGVIDGGPGSFLYEYDHNYTDAEFIETAQHRGVFAPCLKSVVAHNYRPAGFDEVTNRTNRYIKHDYETFINRRPLWGGGVHHYPEQV